MLKLSFLLSFVFLSFACVSNSFADQNDVGSYYECNGFTSCSCDRTSPGASCDYFGKGQGSDMASAAAAAEANAVNNCENECTRKTGNSCYGTRAYNCELVKP
jgi:hypothetical protein